MIEFDCEGEFVSSITDRVHALLFGLNEDIAGELLSPLKLFCDKIEAVPPSTGTNGLKTVADSSAQVIFCSADTKVVSGLRSARPDASIVVVSRHPEVNGWLDSIEAGASDYCAAPFESFQLKWILETSRRSA